MPENSEFRQSYRETLYEALRSSGAPEELLAAYTFESCVKHEDDMEVYFAARKSDGKRAVVRATGAGTEKGADAEYDILSRLNHPAIPKALGVWRTEKYVYFAREYFAGDALDEYVQKQTALRLNALLDIAMQLCDILAYLHRQNPIVIHRDIKPENIILTEDGIVKLIDFDIARKFSETASRDTRVIGTRPYMSPEQFGSEQTDGRADLYSLGVVMIFMGTGKTNKQNLKQYYPYRALAPVIEKCIRKDRAQRYPTARALKRRLLWVRYGVSKKLAVAALAIVCAAGAFAGGFAVGRGRGFEEGVSSIMDAPVATIRQYTAQELNQEIQIDNWYIDRAVRNILNRDETRPIYLSDLVNSVGEIEIYGTYIVHPSLNTVVTKIHREKDSVEYWTDNGFLLSERGDLSSLEDIAQMYYLRHLALSSQSIADLSPLTGLKLESLDVSNNFIGNLLPLKDMVTLKSLDVCQNPLSNLTPISRLLSLEALDASQTQVRDLKPIEGLTKLRRLELNYVDARDFSPIKALSRLEMLKLRGVTAGNYDFLDGMERLAVLDVSDSGFDDIARVAALPALKELDISGTLVDDLTPLMNRDRMIILRCVGIADEVINAVRGDENIVLLVE